MRWILSRLRSILRHFLLTHSYLSPTSHLSQPCPPNVCLLPVRMEAGDGGRLPFSDLPLTGLRRAPSVARPPAEGLLAVLGQASCPPLCPPLPAPLVRRLFRSVPSPRVSPWSCSPFRAVLPQTSQAVGPRRDDSRWLCHLPQPESQGWGSARRLQRQLI